MPISADSGDRLLGVGATAETKFKMGRGSCDKCYLVCLEDSTKWPIWFGDTSGLIICSGTLRDLLYGLGTLRDLLYGLGTLRDSLYGLGTLRDSLCGSRDK